MLATRHTLVGTLGNQVPELHGNGRPALVRHKFNSRFTIVSCCGNGKVYVFLGNYPWKSLLPEHTKCKRQASVRDCTKSARRRFQTQDVSYLERHLTTRPHETLHLTLVRRTKSTFVGYIYKRHTTLAPTNEESAWLNEEKNHIGKKIISSMSASDVSRVVSLVLLTT